MRAIWFLEETGALNIQVPGVEDAEKLLDRADTLQAATTKIDPTTNMGEAISTLVSGSGDTQKTVSDAVRAVKDHNLAGGEETKHLLGEAAKQARRDADTALFGPKTRMRTWNALSDQIRRIGKRATDFEILPQIHSLEEASLLDYAAPWLALEDLSNQYGRIVQLAKLLVDDGFYGRLPDRAEAGNLKLVDGPPLGWLPPGFYEAATTQTFKLRDPMKAMADWVDRERNATDMGAPNPVLIPQLRRQAEEERKQRERDVARLRLQVEKERAHIEALLAEARKTSPLVVV